MIVAASSAFCGRLAALFACLPSLWRATAPSAPTPIAFDSESVWVTLAAGDSIELTVTFDSAGVRLPQRRKLWFVARHTGEYRAEIDGQTVRFRERGGELYPPEREQ